MGQAEQAVGNPGVGNPALPEYLEKEGDGAGSDPAIRAPSPFSLSRRERLPDSGIGFAFGGPVDRIEREKEFDALLAEERDKVFNLLFRLTGDRHVSEDLFQETFLRVYRGLERWEGRATRSTWTRAIALNVFRDHLRRKKRRDEVIVSGLPNEKTPGESPPGASRVHGVSGAPLRDGPAFQPEEALIAAEDRRKLQRALIGLKESLRVPVVLHYIENLPVKEIAETTGRTESDIKVSLHRARKLLKKRLEGER